MQSSFLSWKLCILLAITIAVRSQTILCKNISVWIQSVVFYFMSLLKTSRPGRYYSISLQKYSNKELCGCHHFMSIWKQQKMKVRSIFSVQTYCFSSKYIHCLIVILEGIVVKKILPSLKFACNFILGLINPFLGRVNDKDLSLWFTLNDVIT